MTNEELIKNIKEIQGIVTDWVPVVDPNNDWQRYTITLNTLIKLVESQTKVETNISCEDCPLFTNNNQTNIDCNDLEGEYPEQAIAIVEKWSAEHQKKTRQDEFLKMFPDARIDYNTILNICPQTVDTRETCPSNFSCYDCRRKYWLEEIE